MMLSSNLFISMLLSTSIVVGAVLRNTRADVGVEEKAESLSTESKDREGELNNKDGELKKLSSPEHSLGEGRPHAPRQRGYQAPIACDLVATVGVGYTQVEDTCTGEKTRFGAIIPWQQAQAQRARDK